jgi:transcriptional antiterminator
MGARKNKLNGYEDSFKEMRAYKWREFAQHHIHFVEMITGICFSNDDVLLIGLAMHFKTSIFRARSGLQRKFLGEIHTNTQARKLGFAVWATSLLYRTYFDVIPSDEEIYEVTLHYIYSIRRREKKLRLLLVYNEGIAQTCEMMNFLSPLFQENIEITDICKDIQTEFIQRSKYDLVLSRNEIPGS